MGGSDASGPATEGLIVELRKLLRIARWEVATSTGTVDRRTVVILAVALLAAGAAAPALTAGGGGLDDGIYRVAVEEDHPYHDAVVERDTLRVVGTEASADLRIGADGVDAADSRKGDAALGELRDAVQSYNVRRLRAESDRAAAFPVLVELTFVDRGGVSVDIDDGASGGTGSDGDGGGDATGGDSSDGADGSNGSDGTDGTGGSDDTGPPGDGTGGAGSDTGDGGDVGTGGGPLPIPNLGGGGGVQEGTPADISAPFPFGPLVLAFLFVVPMNFVIQAYGSTIMDERRNRRGELLLVAPVTRVDVVGGKTLPYVGAVLGITIAVAALVGAGALAVAAVVPIGLLFLALTFLAAMFARSYKELTFVTVSISVFVTTFAFVPAIFTDVTPIALISPLTLVVRDLQGTGVGLGGFVFATGPSLVASAVLFGLGVGVYREEDMFTQRPVHLKALDALAAWIHAPWQVAATTALLLPFVFVLELLAVAILFALPLSVSLPAILVLVALIEEVAKSIHVYAAFEHERFERSVRSGLVLGAASGAGFFAAEKVTHAVQLVGLDQLEVGQAAFTPTSGVGPLLAVGLFLAPLALHTATAAISALGAVRGPRRYATGLSVAILVHAGYNLGVILLVT